MIDCKCIRVLEVKRGFNDISRYNLGNKINTNGIKGNIVGTLVDISDTYITVENEFGTAIIDIKSLCSVE